MSQTITDVQAAQRATQRAVMTVRLAGVGLFVLALWLSFSLLLPFKPYRVYGLSGIPEAGCPGDPVVLWLDREVTEPWYLSLSNVNTTSYLENTATGTTVQKITIATPLLAPVGRQKFKSPIARHVPFEVGEWQAVSDYTVYGRVLGFPVPRTQQLHYAKPKTLTALPLTDSRCSGRR